MKVIDLLNGIANKEEVPKTIKYIDFIWTFDKEANDYINGSSWLFADIVSDYDDVSTFLNNIIEVVDKEDYFIDIKELKMTQGSIDNKEFIASYITNNRLIINDLIKNQKLIIEKLKEQDNEED